MSEFFFNRHNNISPNIEPFNINYSTKDFYYTSATNCNSASACASKDTYDAAAKTDVAANIDTNRNAIINDCMCDYKKKVDNYLAKTSSEMTIDGVTDDSSEKYNQESALQSNCVKTYIGKVGSIIISLRDGSNDSNTRATIEYKLTIENKKIKIGFFTTLKTSSKLIFDLPTNILKLSEIYFRVYD